MSILHDALRRGRSPARASRSAPHSPQTDTVLATLGYVERPRAAARRLLTIVCLAGAAIAGYVVWSWFTTPVPSVRASVAVHTPRRSSPPAAIVTAPAASALSNVPHHAVVPPVTVAKARHVERDRSTPGSAASEPAARHVRPPTRATSVVRGETAKGAGTDEFELALYYQRAGDFDRAKQHYLAVLSRDVLNVEAHNNLGLLYKERGLLDEAVGEFHRALSANPRYGRALNNLGVTLLAQGQPDAAAGQFEAALAVDPHDVDALVNLALARKAAGDPAAAQRLLIRALTVDPHSPTAHYNLAVEYEMAGDAPRALEHYRAFLEYAGADYAARAAGVRTHVEALDRHIS
ncbi:MAG TPA: tetratricopeptide repeat protein [Vicinamibacterales bacterium]|nr:tetratricopeptide repeat protein [Vicinamibacterales bacterium]